MGIDTLQDQEVARYQEDCFAFPPYQYRDEFMVRGPGGRLQPPTAVMREVLMGYGKDYTLTCWPSALRRSNPRGYEQARLSLVGNAFCVPAMAMALSLLLKEWGLIQRLPTAAELADPSQPFQLVQKSDEPLYEKEAWDDLVTDDGAVTLARHYMTHAGIRGGDIRHLQAGVKLKSSHTQGVNADEWRWKDVISCQWRVEGEHINALESRAYWLTLRWRARTESQIGGRFLHLVDSLVTFAAMTKGRSSSSRLKHIILKCNAVVLAAHFTPYIAYVRTHVNPADRPSRRAEFGKLKPKIDCASRKRARP